MAVSLKVSPATISLNKAQQFQFHADVSGGSQKVTWATDIGTIDASGKFTPPVLTTSVQTATITATSVDDGSKTATATVTLPIRNGISNTPVAVAATIAAQTKVPVTLPTTRGRTSPVKVTITDYSLTVPRGVQVSVPQDVKTYLDNIGATAA